MCVCVCVCRGYNVHMSYFIYFKLGKGGERERSTGKCIYRDCCYNTLGWAQLSITIFSLSHVYARTHARTHGV